jgi:hypothetical protein
MPTSLLARRVALPMIDWKREERDHNNNHE